MQNACYLLFTSFLFSLPPAAWAQPTAPPERPVLKQYLYVLRVVPRLRLPEGWTERDNAVVAAHFERLKRLTEEGTVLLAGRTQGLSADDFGLVIFEAASDAEAQALMEADPVVREGLMTARLFPYRVALMHTPAAGDA